MTGYKIHIGVNEEVSPTGASSIYPLTFELPAYGFNYRCLLHHNVYAS